jgi:dUTP pyrophosphatase
MSYSSKLPYTDLTKSGLYSGILKGTPESVGLDLMCSHDILASDFKQGEPLKVPLGIRVRIPTGHFGILASRSSTFKRYGLMLSNGIGIIDSDYRDELIASFHHVGEPKDIPAGTRLVQLIILPYPVIIPVADDVKSDETERRGGFGSTG